MISWIVSPGSGDAAGGTVGQRWLTSLRSGHGIPDSAAAIQAEARSAAAIQAEEGECEGCNSRQKKEYSCPAWAEEREGAAAARAEAEEATDGNPGMERLTAGRMGQRDHEFTQGTSEEARGRGQNPGGLPHKTKLQNYRDPVF